MKRAVIIGASSGLGLEVAKILLNDGWQLGVAARRSDLLRELQQQWPDRVMTAAIDVNDPQADAQLLALIDRMGGMDLYFHAAGIGWQNPQLEKEKELATVTTNGVGFTRMVGAAFRYFAEHGGGHIAAITSIAGTKGLGPAPAYSATKAFQNCYLQALEQQANARKLNIRFTDIRPGFVATDLLGDNPRYPLLMQPQPVAQAIVRAIYGQKHVAVIDTRWHLITALWRRVPRWVWRRLRLAV
ncbi:MAG: SDR family NAD(P)-dependent oxidoreductase [Prevotella sp.]|nr:SDR family NAD(P)-dependent oxidoreductase [Prevotella sp.]